MSQYYYNRYKSFLIDGEIRTVPGIVIPELLSDKRVVYKNGETRLDKLSQMYYNSPYYGWLIMLANPEYGGLEFNIPDRTIIRIPFPLATALEVYSSQISKHLTLYGE